MHFKAGTLHTDTKAKGALRKPVLHVALGEV